MGLCRGVRGRFAGSLLSMDSEPWRWRGVRWCVPAVGRGRVFAIKDSGWNGGPVWGFAVDLKRKKSENPKANICYHAHPVGEAPQGQKSC